MKGTKKEMIARAKEIEDEILQRWYMQDVVMIMSDFCKEFELSYQVDYIEWDNSYAYQTTYIDNLFKGKWYHIILDVDFETRFETVKEFVEYMLKAENVSKDFILNFKVVK